MISAAIFLSQRLASVQFYGEVGGSSERLRVDPRLRRPSRDGRNGPFVGELQPALSPLDVTKSHKSEWRVHRWRARGKRPPGVTFAPCGTPSGGAEAEASDENVAMIPTR